jgi:hypothetical protein
MVRPGDTCSYFPRLIRRCRRAPLVGGFACALVFAAIPTMAAEDATASASPDIAVATPEPSATSGASATPAAATAVRPDETAGAKSSDQQRRVLMLLLMNSAGPVRPFGNLGR